MRFPVVGLGPPGFRQTHGGVAFVAFDPTSGSTGQPSRRIWVGVADPGDAHLYRSEGGGETWVAATGPALLAAKDVADFAPVAGRGLPADLEPAGRQGREAQSALLAAPDRAGTLWLQAGARLFRSIDGGVTFAPASSRLDIELFGLGRNGVFAVGTRAGICGVWRSVDTGRNWVRIDDDAHRWGGRYRVVSGDPRREGRVYLGADGRGLFYGDPIQPR